ncbi:hypothetical protein [Corallococcus aberystwythensis]|uniref:Uncharacterized protein n=1 Tax=Corallococcus aberystwythensis TaxID=2316722 RepID=A0A3A8QJD5_9BACT|nr:hypothetical protein [Corallococcus aberystwythensis]RKH66445.1 hypothetical protein D7W81_15390 [Corallococcus aberystwythensis]
MSLGFEVELNHVNVRTQSGGLFGEPYKGVTLFKTQVRPGVNAVIETGTMGGSSTLELVSNVDINPYDSAPAWKVQVGQLVALVEALSHCTTKQSIDSFVRQTRSAPLKFSPKRTSKDVDVRMGAQPVSFWQSLCCCWPSEDQRVTEVRSATLHSSGGLIASDCIQVNFSTNLDHLGDRLVSNQHPFEELLDNMHLDDEMHVANAIYDLGLPNQFGRQHPRLLAYLFLVLHRLTFEGSKVPGKNRFLFLPRFDLLDIRERCLSTMERRILDDMEVQDIAQLRPVKSRLPLTGVFSKAYRMSRSTVHSPVRNTVEEFLGAALHGNLGGLSRKVVTEHIMRVPDSTLPRWVDGADNIVFEGRLDTWTRFAGENTDLSELNTLGTLDALRQGLTRLGDIVTSYDVAPDTGMVTLDIEGSREGEGDGLLIPINQRL